MTAEAAMGRPDLLSELVRLENVEYTLVILGAPDEAPPGFLLGPARLSVGAGDADDVFLSGVGVVPGHVRMIFLEGRLTLLSATEEVRIDGKPVSTFPAELAPLQTLSLSPDTHLAYGPVGSEWPLAPEWVGPAELPDAMGVQPEAAPVRTARRRPPPRTVRQQVVHSARLGGVVMGVAALLVVGVVVFNLVWGDHEVVDPAAGAIDRSADVLLDVLSRDPRRFASVRMERRDDGAITVQGFLDSEDAYRGLAEEVRQQVVSSGGNVRLDVLTRERLATLVNDQIARYPLASRIDVAPDAVHVRIIGFQTDAVDPDRLKADLSRLQQRIQPRTLDVTLALEPPPKVLEEISTHLEDSPVTRGFSVSLGETGGNISGLVAPDAEPEARHLLEELVQGYADRVPLSFELKVDPKLNFTLVGLALGGDGDSATLVQRGRAATYRIGESVFDTAELREIRGNGVVVAMGRRELFIPLAAAP